jgi:predicted  nucleic acid-binding Zn-ribbon protein
MDFGQLLQAVSGAGGAGARAKTKVARRKVYSESRARDSVAELDSEEGWGYDEVVREEPEDRDARDKDDWDLVDEEVSL